MDKRSTETAAEPKWWRKEDDEFNVAMTNLEVARILNGKACAEIERLKIVVRDLVDAIEDGDAILHHSNPVWDRVAIYAKSAAVSAAKDVTNEQ